MSNDPLSSVYSAQTPKDSLLKRYGGKIAGGIACSAFVAFVMHLPYIKLMLLWSCEFVVMVFGRPHGAEKLDKIGDKVVVAIDKGKDVAQRHHYPPDAVLGNALAPVKQVSAVKKDIENLTKGAEAVKDGAKAVDCTFRNFLPQTLKPS